MSQHKGWQVRFIEHRFRPQLALALILLLVFWDGFFAGVPRGDHVQYLFQQAMYGDRPDVLSATLAWNRTFAFPGDEILYRPVLYFLLLAFHRLFGTHFVLWQVAGWMLHLLVVLGLYALLRRGALRMTWAPFGVSLIFGVALLGSELVLWNHITGYVMFSAFVVARRVK